MTQTVTQTVTRTATPASAPSAGRHPGWLVRHRTSLVIALGAAAALAVVVVLGGTDDRTATPLDPDNPGPDGARALARVLDDQGVDVTVVRSADALEDAEAGSGTTVLVTSTEFLGQSTTGRLLAHASDARLVLAEPGPGLVDTLGAAGMPSRVPVGDGREADCPDPLLQGLTVEVDRALAYRGRGCFPGADGSLVVERNGVRFLGPAEALTNDQILRADNAAVAVRLLGQDDRLVWYIPTIEDLVADDGVSLATLVPRWLRPGLWLAAIAALSMIVWRARRLGPLASEPLPVVVKAIETTRSRGRLYRKAGDRAHAADALRRSARASAAERLRLVPMTDDALVRDVARHVDRPESEIADLLLPLSAPAADKDLIALASALAELDREVRRS